MSQTRTRKKSLRKSPALPEEIKGPLPMVVRALIALAALGALLYAVRIWLTPIKSWDLWFHMAAGKWIFTHRGMPPGDVFSAAYRGHDWIVNAWLSDLFFWATYQLSGANGILIAQILLSLAVFVIIGYAAYRISGRPTLGILTAYLAIVGTYFRFNARPELFTMVLMAATLAIVYQYKFKQSDRLWWLIPLGALWPNLHMGFAVIPILLGCVLAGDGVMAVYLRSQKKPIPDGVIEGPRLKRLAWISLAMMAATIINPYGPGAWLFVTRLSGQFTKIAEWEPLLQVAHTIEWLPFAAMGTMLLITLGALLLSRRAQDLTGLLMATAFTVAALKFSRQTAQFCLVAPFVIAAASRGLRFPRFAASPALRVPHPRRAAIGVVGLLALELGVYGLLVFQGVPDEVSGSPFGFGVDRTKTSERAIQFLRENGLVGRKIYNSLEAGSWLIWKLGGEQPVFIDGRLDMYGCKALDDYLAIATSEQCSDKLQALGIEYCYFRFPEGNESRKGNPYHAQTLATDPNWALVFYDDGALIYVPRTPGNAELIRKHEYRFLNPLTTSDLQFRQLDANRIVQEANRSLGEAPDSARAHLTAGVALHLVGRNEDALKRFELARRYATRWGTGLMGSLEDFMGRACMGAKDTAGAIRHLKKAIEYAQKGADRQEREGGLRNNLGYIYMQAGKYAEAERELKMAIAVGNAGPLPLVNLGRVRMGQRRFADAIPFLEKALDQSSDVIIARILMAQCYGQIGDKEQAFTQLDIAARMDPKMVSEAAAEPGFDPIRKDPRFRAITGR